LIHVTELSDQAFAKVEDVLSIGDGVTTKVIKLDPEHKKVSLSIKEYMIVECNQVNRDDIFVGGDASSGGSEEDDTVEAR
jgi:small subunit ribosomal protein S1